MKRLSAFSAALFACRYWLFADPPSQVRGNLDRWLTWWFQARTMRVCWPQAKSEEERLKTRTFSRIKYAVADVQQGVLRRLLKQLVAVVVGSLLYFFVLMPHLPLAGRHQPFRLDIGLLVDAWVCLVLYGIIEWLDRKWRRDSTTEGSRKR